MNKYFTLLKTEFQNYSLQRLLKDFLAGLTVAAVALPLALAFGVSSGADAAAGLITAIIAGFVISALSGASFQISGPTGAMSAILISIVGRYSLQGVFLVSVIAGLFLLLAGVFKLGKLVSFIPRPVITGFTTGIALIIALGQIDHLFGVTSTGDGTLERIGSYFALGFNIQWQSLLVGGIVIATMLLWPKKLGNLFPSSLAGLVLASLASVLIGLDVPTIGAIPQTLIPEVRLQLDWNLLATWPSLISPALSIAALGMIESLLCGTSALRMKKDSRFDADQELIAQGVGNILIPFFGGIPATAAIARTSVAIKSGSQTRLTGILHAVMLLACMFLLGGVIAQVPYAALAGVLLVTAWRMNEWPAITSMFSKKQISALLKFVITLAATVAFDLTVAIIIGVVVSALLFIFNASKLDISSSQVKNELLHTCEDNIEEQHGNTTVVYITGPLFFGNAERLPEQVHTLVSDSSIVILSMRGVPMIDTTGQEVLLDLIRACQMAGQTVMLCGLNDQVRNRLDTAGLADLLSESAIFPSVDRALLSEINA